MVLGACSTPPAPEAPTGVVKNLNAGESLHLATSDGKVTFDVAVGQLVCPTEVKECNLEAALNHYSLEGWVLPVTVSTNLANNGRVELNFNLGSLYEVKWPPKDNPGFNQQPQVYLSGGGDTGKAISVEIAYGSPLWQEVK